MAKELKVNTKTKITTLEDAQRAIKELQEVLNKLIEKVDSPAEQELKESDGDSGDIQITQNVDKSYNFSVRTEDGWKTPVIGNTAIAFKDKPKVDPKANKKSIDEIESEDTTTEASDAKKTIYDEKNDKFVLPRADYNSGWTALAGGENNVDFVHNLGVQEFSLFQILIKDSSGRIFYPTFEAGYHSNDYGLFVTAKDDNTMNVGAGNTGIYFYDNTYIGNSVVNINSDGFIKILLWK